MKYLNYIKYSMNYIKLIYNSLKIYNNPDKIRDDKFVNNFINIISNNGCMLIKIIQWGLPRYEMIYGTNDFTKQLEKFYDNCPEHSIAHTDNTYRKEFNKSIFEDYDIIGILGCGSIGQVYKVLRKTDNKYYALKVIHPNTKEEFVIFKIFFYIIYNLININNALPIKNINVLVNDIELQLNYNNEAYNCNFFYNLYKDNKYINIPKIEYYNENLILMEIFNTKSDEKITDLGKYKCLLLLIIFINNACLNNLSHGDMHQGNWSLHYNNYSYINIIDFGFCFNINYTDYIIIDKYIGNPTNLDILKKIIEYLSSDKSIELINTISLYLYSITKNIESKNIEKYINCLFITLNKYNIKINTSILNSLFLYYQMSSMYKFILDNENRSNNIIENNFSLELYNICETYNICDEYKNHLNKNIIPSFNFKTNNKRLDKYKNLCLK
jgi:predicted unusual protein kinase regulating ubiquinone biosynthesis (AarF/ABC1/UbiB family)